MRETASLVRPNNGDADEVSDNQGRDRAGKNRYFKSRVLERG